MIWLEKPSAQRRFKQVRVNLWNLAQLLMGAQKVGETTYTTLVSAGVPEDATLVYVWIDEKMTPPEVGYVFEHPSWDPVPEGAYAPDFFPCFTRNRADRVRT